MKQKIKRWKR